MTKYRIKLSSAEREELLSYVQKGKQRTKNIQKAYVILGSDACVERKSERELSELYHLSVKSVERIRKSFFEEGMGIFEPKAPVPRSSRKITGEVEAHLIALVCSEPPAGHCKWKLQLLADKLVELKVIDAISATAVGTTLKKTNYSLSRKKCG